jgi:hypothetical protein
MYDHVSWVNDSMVFVFPAHKGDQEGRNSLPKHVYANTAEPSICPILSFAVYIFTRGYEREGSKKTIFAGAAESRFSQWLSNLCVVNKDVLKNQGVEISMIGTHSFRKGIASFLSGTPGGPTIYLRAGWSLGPVQSRYILEGEGSDQLCGRAACGLPLTDVSFANLPPHFLQTDEEYLTSEEWDDILPGYSTFYPLNFREVIPFLLASLIYHQPYLVSLQATNPRHPLFLQRVWTSGVLVRLKDMRLEIVSKLEQLPEALKQSMLENFQVEGTVPITRHEMQEMMRSSIGELQRTIENSLNSIASRSIPTATYVNAPIAGHVNNVAHYTTWNWKGRLHPVPEDFEFPV